MTRRERVISAFNHIETDYVPTECSFTLAEYEKMIEYLNGSNDLDKLVNSHFCALSYCGDIKPINTPEHVIDDFGVIWNRSGADKDIGVIEGLVIPEPDIKYYKEPLNIDVKIHNSCKAVVENAGDRFTYMGIGFSLFERFWSLCGMENALVYMITEEDFTNELLDKICDFNLKIIDIINMYPLDGVYFGDDWGQQKGLIMGPALWRKYIKPRLAKMYKRVKDSGKYVIQHSCGDIEQVYDDLIEIGLTCHQTFQPEIYDIYKVKEKYGDRLSFWGGISTQRLLPSGTVEEVKRETARIMKVMKKNGGYIAAPTHFVPPDVPPQNIVAMLDVFNNQDKYI